MFETRNPPVSDEDLLRLLESLTHNETSSFGPVVFDPRNPVHREAVNRGLAVARPWPLVLKHDTERQCLLVNVTTGWQWMRSHRPPPARHASMERRQ
jgi:hypothetical protein